MTDSSINPENANSSQLASSTEPTSTVPATTVEEDKLFLLKTYEALRSYVEHEDNLINIRLTWLLTIQTLLFAAYGVLEGNLLKYQHGDLGVLKNLTLILKILGPVSSVLVLGGTHSASRAIDKLVCFWQDKYEANSCIQLPPLTGGGKNDENDPVDRYLGTKLCSHKWASYGIPSAFYIAWMFILYDILLIVLFSILFILLFLIPFLLKKGNCSTRGRLTKK